MQLHVNSQDATLFPKREKDVVEGTAPINTCTINLIDKRHRRAKHVTTTTTNQAFPVNDHTAGCGGHKRRAEPLCEREPFVISLGGERETQH